MPIPAVQWKDVAHLYLGCDVVIDYDPAGIAGMLIDKCVGVSDYGISVSNGYIEKFEKTKPILRKLDSMTEDEKKELITINDAEGSISAISFNINSNLDFYFKRTNFAVVAFLLSKYFDIFNLIDSGQAIDAKTIK